MHDLSELEARQVPTVGIASTQFREASAAQGRALGLDPPVVFVAHPIQDRTDEEMRALADAAVDEVLAALTEPR